MSPLRLLAFLSVATVLAACSREPAPGGESFLNRVPADSPYVFAGNRPLPSALLERQHQMQMMQVRDALLRLEEFQAATVGDADAAMEKLGDRVVRIATAAAQELDAALQSGQGPGSLGFKPDASFVIYGRGLLPVVVTEIADAQKVEALFGRIEKRAGVNAPRAKLGDIEYRRISLDPVDVVVAIEPSRLTIGVLPTAAFDAELPYVLGRTTPEQHLAAAGTLDELRRSHGFAGYGDGYLDLRALLDIFLQRRGDGLVDILVAKEGPPPQVTAACAGLLDTLVGSTPRYVIGISHAEERLLGIRGILETSPAVAAYMQKVAAPVPGLGSSDPAMASVGVGVNLPEVRNGINALLNTLIDQGGACEWVDADKLRSAMPQLNLALGPMTAGIKGFKLRFDGLQFKDNRPDPLSLKASLLASVDDPRGVFAMLSMVNPGLATLNVPGDGTPVQVPDELVPPDVPPMKVAIRDRALLVMADGGEAAPVAALFDAKPADPAPIMAIDYRAHELFSLIGDAGLARIDQMKDVADTETMRRELENLREQSKFYDRLQMSLYATDKGLVGEQLIYLR